MPKHRNHLPQLDGGIFLTDGGLETTLIFHEGLDLPFFAACDLIRTESGRATLRRYYTRYIEIARAEGTGFILESPTWRASPDWGAKLGYSGEDLADVNRQSIALMQELRDEFATERSPMVVSGCVGPRGDGYDPGRPMRISEAETYHAEQVRIFGDTGADMVTAITMTSAAEAAGVARASGKAGIPVAISFTLETDGRLPTGQSLKDAIGEVDAATGGLPAYYMINCAHPTHFGEMLDGGAWIGRVRGVRANASTRSHGELDEAPDLDDGDPVELGSQYAALRTLYPRINVLGGCCGTDHRHIAQIGHACRPLARAGFA